MIEVKEIGNESREQWNLYVRENPFSIAWHVYEWSEVVANHYKFQFIPLAAFEGKEIVGLLPLYLSTSGQRKLISVPFAVAGGIVANEESIQTELLQAAIIVSERLGNIPITLKQYKIRVPGNLRTDENYFNLELPLQENLSALKKLINPENTIFAQDAVDKGLKVEYPAQDIPEFYDLLLRHSSAEGVPCTSQAWIKTLIDFGLYSAAIARIDGVPVAGTLVKRFKKTVSFPFSCITPDVNEASLNSGYGLYWELIKRFASEGVEIFHSGRIPKTQEALDFRLGWGGTPYPYFYQYYPNTEAETEFVTKRGLKRKLITRVWKELPLPLVRRLGPLVVSRFP